MPVADVLLAPAAVALALAVALGMTAFELDLPGYRFGWRQAASVTALVATVAGALPVVGVAAGGRWGLPGSDFAELLSWMPEQQAKGPFRVLWLGDPQALPLGSWRLGDGVGYATSRGGPPDASSLWPGGSPQATQLVADAVKVARRRGTTRLGRLLAPMAVRYVVVPLRAAPAEADTRPLPPPADLAPTLEAQVDLEKLESDDALLVYENAAWIPGRALLGPEAVAASRGPGLDPLRSLDLARPGPVLARRSPTRADGRLARGDVVFLSEASSPRWRLRAAGKDATRTKAFGWANAFRATAGGPASLRHRASSLHYAGIVIQLALWVFAVVRLVAWRRAT